MRVLHTPTFKQLHLGSLTTGKQTVLVGVELPSGRLGPLPSSGRFECLFHVCILTCLHVCVCCRVVCVRKPELPWVRRPPTLGYSLGGRGDPTFCRTPSHHVGPQKGLRIRLAALSRAGHWRAIHQGDSPDTHHPGGAFEGTSDWHLPGRLADPRQVSWVAVTNRESS